MCKVQALSYLEEQFHHVCVDQAVDGLSVHMGDEVSSLQAGLLSSPTVLHVLEEQRCRNKLNIPT